MSQTAIVQLLENWKSNLLNSRESIDLLKERWSIESLSTIKGLEIGLVDVPEKDGLPPEIYKSLNIFGVTNEHLNGMAALPLRKKDNSICNFLFLDLNGGENRILRNGGVINAKAFKVFKSLVVVDNIDDFFVCYEKGKKNVVPLVRSDDMPADFAAMLASSEVEELILINDSPYWKLIEEKIKSIGVKRFQVDLPEGMNAREYLGKVSGQKFYGFIEGEKAKDVKDRSNGENKPEYLKVEELTGEMRFTGDEREYRVRGFNRDGFEKIVQINLEIDGRSFPDKVDLSRSQSRTKFANIVSAEFEMGGQLIRDDLAFIYKTLDKIQDERFREKAGMREKDIYIITPDERSKAIERITKRDLLNEILIKDTEKLGYVGEDVNKKLFYLSATSRLTGQPISVLDISPSGTGKSFGISTIMDLMPADELLRYSRLTPNALYYKSEGELIRKILYIEEITGMEESLAPIRMLLSSGELAVSVVEKDPRTGQLRTVERRIRVDIPILSSGVQDIFDEETLSRFILTYNDVTEGHLNKILKAQSFQFSLDGERIHLQRDRILKKHRDIQKVFDPEIVVINNYAERIKLNARLHIVTRKQIQYLRLIYNIAFLRQHSRKKRKEVDRFGNEFVYIEVEKDDIVTANEIVGYVFRFANSDLTKRLHDAYLMIKEYCMEQVKEKRIGLHEFEFSRRAIRQFAGWEQSTAKRLFDELEALEYIRKSRGDKQGSQYLYRLVPFHERQLGDNDLQLLEP